MAPLDEPARREGAPVEIAGLRLLDEIGRGADSIVYRAAKGDRTYAVKLQRAAGGDGSDSAVRFRREVSVLTRVRHPGLPGVLEVGTVDGRLFSVMEFVEGRTLASLLQSGSLPEESIVSVAKLLASTLALVHRHGLVHRDIKPGNVLLDRAGRAKLIDFGLVTDARAGGGGTDAAVGTFIYSAPEQTGMLKRPVDGRSDLYSLGVLLYECATGAPPFRSTDLGELVRLHAVAPPTPVSDLNPSITPALARAIEKLLAKDPDDRYQTGRALLLDLERLPILNASLSRGEDVVFGAGEEQAEPAWETALVGRARELAELGRLWSDARGGEGGVVLILGESGCGKSRLAAALAAEAREMGALVMTAACSRGDLQPFAPIRAAVDDLLARIMRLPTLARVTAEERLRRAVGALGPLLLRFSPGFASIFPGTSPLPDEAEFHEQFYGALADLFLRLAVEWGAALFVLDDIDQLDEGSRRVLQRLTPLLTGAPLLVLGTARAITPAEQSGLLPEGTREPATLTVTPLEEPEVAALAAAYLGGEPLERDFVKRLAVRSNGNPLAVAEYLRAMLDAGLLLPSWGSWRIDADGLERLALPTDVLQLIVQRVEGLSEKTRALLKIAAAAGTRFRPDLIARVASVAPDDVAAALGEAAWARLVESTTAREWAFVHERVREALLSRVPEPERATLHQAIAESLDALGGEGTAHVYALARHYGLGDMRKSPVRAYETNRAAGEAALASLADEDAYGFFECATRASALMGRAPDSTLEEQMGDVCGRTAHNEESRERYGRALGGATPLARARIRAKLAGLDASRRDLPRAWQQIEAGFAELKGSPPRQGPFALLRSFAEGAVAIAGLRLGWSGGAAPAERERLQILARLYEEAAKTAYLAGRRWVFLQVVLRSLYAARKLGASRELARGETKYAILLASIGHGETAELHAQRALAIAEELKDPITWAHSLLYGAVARHLAGHPREAEERSRRALGEHGRWLEAGDYRNGIGDLVWNLAIRGYAREALTWVDALREKGMDARQQPYSVNRASILAILGRHAEGWEVLESFDQSTTDPFVLNEYITHAVVFFAEAGEFGPPLEELFRRHAALGIKPGSGTLHSRSFWVFKAYARMAHALAAPAADRAAAYDRLEAASADLKAAIRHPVLLGHSLVVEGVLLHLRGRARESAAKLAEASALADEVDSPWIHFEVARHRARVLAEQGNTRPAQRRARAAQEMAFEHGWVGRARRINQEFALGDSAAPYVRSTESSSKDSTSGRAIHLQRHLEALSQVSLAAATVLDPDQQARAALDEIVRILAAERAFLFLLDDEGQELVLKAGRDARGNDLTGHEGYSRTVVERVRVSQHPLVHTGFGDGTALGTESVVRHDIRSILAAPLMMRDRLVGVVYLDSRLVRGIFSEKDVEILLAIANHIAIAIETARAAKLEGQFQAERRERELAEKLRAVTGSLASTLDRPEVMERLLQSLAQIVPSDRSAVLLADEGGFRVEAVAGDASLGAAQGTLLRLEGDEVLGEVVRTLEPVLADAQGAVKSRLCLPLVFGGALSGIVTLDSTAAVGFGAREADVGLTLAGQAATALENARLFAEVQRLAITDELTRTYSRRHLLVLAGRELARCRRYNRPLAAILLDIDHFKAVNDTYGHATGDQVLREVARRCASIVRNIDILGRYGGEEFVVILPETDLEAARATAERLREVVASEPVVTPRGPLTVGMSLGVAGWTEETQTLDGLLDRADAAMYEAKEAGRNRVAVAS